jgi:HAMP domain-containing protein
VLKRMSIAKRFSFILFLIFIITLPIITTTMYFFFRENAIREVADKALLTMNSMEAVRKYVVEEVRPAVRQELPDKFLLQAMSGVYAIRRVAGNLQTVQPMYNYKQAASDPRVPSNKADYFETWILSQFRDNAALKEFAGLRSDGIEPLYYLARPIRIDRQECLNCHGDPAAAPKAVVDKYGATAGYNLTMNALMGANIIYVPASIPISIAKRSTMFVAIVFTALFLILFLVINILIRKSIIRPIESFVHAADQVSKGKMDNAFTVDTEDELKTLAEAFTRLKTSIRLMMDMIKKSG